MADHIRACDIQSLPGPCYPVRMRVAVAFVSLLAACVKPTESVTQEASPPAASVVATSAKTDAALTALPQPPAKRLPPLVAPPNEDFRLTSFPPSMRKVGAVVVDTAGRPFVEIAGIDAPDEVHAEDPFVVRLYYRVLATTSKDLEIGFHIDGMKARFNADHAPMAGAYPTSQWKKGELLVDTVAARVAHQGSYVIYVFVQVPRAGARLVVESGPREDAGADSRIVATTLHAD